MEVISRVEATRSEETASVGRKQPGSYRLELTVHADVPAPSRTLEQITRNDPTLPAAFTRPRGASRLRASLALFRALLRAQARLYQESPHPHRRAPFAAQFLRPRDRARTPKSRHRRARTPSPGRHGRQYRWLRRRPKLPHRRKFHLLPASDELPLETPHRASKSAPRHNDEQTRPPQAGVRPARPWRRSKRRTPRCHRQRAGHTLRDPALTASSSPAPIPTSWCPARSCARRAPSRLPSATTQWWFSTASPIPPSLATRSLLQIRRGFRAPLQATQRPLQREQPARERP